MVLLALGPLATGRQPVEAQPKVASPYFSDTTGAKVAVKGQYTPIVGRFTRLDLDDIIWYSGAYEPGAPDLTESRWSPCPGCAGGPFTKTTLKTQVHRWYTPVVGDFAGDPHDDIFWFSWDASYLWTNDGAGSFTSKPLSLKGVGDSFDPVVLRDSRDGSGKDDVLWDRADHEPWNSVLWVFPDDGSGVPVRTEVPEENGPMTGDFDGNGTADLFEHPWPAWCDQGYGDDCTTSDTAPTPLRYERRATSESTTFTVVPQTVQGDYWPLVGRFEGAGDPTDDIVWVGGVAVVNRGQTYPPVRWHDGPDGLWLGRTSGHFAKGSTSIPVMDEALVLHRDVGDTVFFPRLGKVWAPHWAQKVRTANVVQPETAVVGRFTTADRDDVFVYWPGTRGEHLLHPSY